MKAKTSHAKKPRLNSHTGTPRKWVCFNHSYYDRLLEDIEALYYLSYKEGTERHRKTGKPESEQFRKLRHRIGESFERIAFGLCRDDLPRTKLPELTEAEKRYCELEDIDPQDFLARKSQ